MLQDENAALKAGCSEPAFETPSMPQTHSAAAPPPLISITSADSMPMPQPTNGALLGDVAGLEGLDEGVDGFGDGEFIPTG